MIRLSYDRGSVLIAGEGSADIELPGARPDPRVGCLRAPGRCYRDIVLALTDRELEFEDEARSWGPMPIASKIERQAYPYQDAAVEAWCESQCRGVVVLPTGAGKTFVAQMAIERAARPVLVVAPTLDLMQQWYSVLASSFAQEVGLVGGGYNEIHDLTVTTYDSAYIHIERLGARFGLLVFDECHHLPGASYQLAAESALAPFRLGLTATPEREDGRETYLDELIGPVVYRRDIKELSGEYLSSYETVRVRVSLSEEERERYVTSRELYRKFVYENRISFGAPGGWTRFLTLTSRSEEGRKAFLAYREQKRIAEAPAAKIDALEDLMHRHRRERVLVFTNDNETAYKISRRFLIPVITHQSKVKERHEILQRFNDGSYPFLVTSKVLNEGVDVPAASVAVVLSGSGTVREHVQRLGRILRRAEGKHAILYEVLAEDTGEEFVSERRRRHSAYE